MSEVPRAWQPVRSARGQRGGEPVRRVSVTRAGSRSGSAGYRVLLERSVDERGRAAVGQAVSDTDIVLRPQGRGRRLSLRRPGHDRATQRPFIEGDVREHMLNVIFIVVIGGLATIAGPI